MRYSKSAKRLYMLFAQQMTGRRFFLRKFYYCFEADPARPRQGADRTYDRADKNSIPVRCRNRPIKKIICKNPNRYQQLHAPIYFNLFIIFTIRTMIPAMVLRKVIMLIIQLSLIISPMATR